MTKLMDRITGMFKQAAPLPAGVYHYQTPSTAPEQFRLHLRVNPDGNGLLIINASTILHLNQTAAEYAFHLVQDHSPDQASKAVSDRYRISQEEAARDYIDLKDKVFTLLEVPDLDPVSFLEISREDPYSGAATVPYRLDCALTYLLPEQTSPELAPVRRVDRELSTEEWKTIINRAWEVGIPHLIFTGGEPTLREDLIDLIKQAEQNGQVTGLLTDGYKLGEGKFRKQILASGLDHLLFALTPADQQSWSALKAVLKEDLYTTVHLTITSPELLRELPQIITRCQELGANAISLSISDPNDSQLKVALDTAQTLAAEAKLPLKWDLPVPYSKHNPINLELEEHQEPIQGAGRAWFYVEPDGDVLPAQGVNQVLGNLLADNWQELWQQP